MKAITIWQPWGSLIMAGVKPWEWRGAAPLHGEKLLTTEGLILYVAEGKRLVTVVRADGADDDDAAAGEAP